MEFVKACFIFTICFVYLSANARAANITFAIILDRNGTGVSEAVNKAITDINADASILSGHTVQVEQFTVDGVNRFSVVQSMCSSNPVATYDAVVDVTTTDGRCASLSIAQAQDAAFMSSHRERCYDTDAPSIHFNNDVYFRAIALVALKQNASREAMAVFYDDSFDIGAVIPMEGVEYVPTYLYKIPATDAEILTLLTRVKSDTAASEFVIASTAAVADRVLAQAASLSLMSNLLHWFVVTRDLESITCASCGTNQVIFLRHFVQDSTALSALQSAVSSWSSLSYKRLDAIFAYEAVRGAAKILSLVPNPEIGNSSFSCYTPQNLTLNRYTTFVDKMKNLTQYNGILTPIFFNNTMSSIPVTLSVYKCTSTSCVDTGSSYSATTDELSSSMSFTFQTKETLDVLAVEDPPFVIKNSSGFFGYSVDCLKYIANKLNFNYVIRDPLDKKYGIKQSDGTWSGMIGEIAQGKADMAIGAITINAERESVVDMTIPYYDYAGLQILMSKKQVEAGDKYYFLKVFTLHVWLCIGATLVVTGVLVTVFDKLSPYSFQNKSIDEMRDGTPEGKVFSLKESMWFVLGAYTMAGESFDPRATSTRMLVAGFWVFSFIMYAMYTANLAASLTVSKLSSSITSVKELSAQTEVKYTVISDTIGQTFFSRMKYIEGNFFNIWKDISIGNEYNVDKVSKYSVWEYPIEERYTDMYDRMLRWGLVNNTQEALTKMKDGWAVFVETPFIKYLMNQDCDLYNVGEVLSSRPYGIVLKNKSPLTRQVNLIILEMQRDRIMEDYKLVWWSKDKTQCPTVDDSGGIKVDQLAGVFIFLAIGVGLGALVLLAEFIAVKIFGKEAFLPKESDAMALGAPQPAAPSTSSHINLRMHSARPRSMLRSASHRSRVNESFENDESIDGPQTTSRRPQRVDEVDEMIDESINKGRPDERQAW